MVNKIKCHKITVLVFGVLEVIAALALIGFGCVWLVAADDVSRSSEHDENFYGTKLDKDSADTVRIGLKFIAIIFIVGGILSLIDGIIAIVGSVKENKPLLIIHAVVLCLALLGYIYNIFVAFSIQNIVALLMTGLRVGIVASLIHLLKTDSPNRDIAMSQTSKHVV
ncbi:hypothetical protein CHUAL_001284 [Chamberlinius hualienensis]